MKPLIALLILGSIATSASAAGSDIHGLVDAQTGHAVISEQSTPISTIKVLSRTRADISAVAVRASVIGNRRLPWNKLNSSKLV